MTSKKHTWAIKLFINLYLIAALFSLFALPFASHLTVISAVILVIFYPLRYAAKTGKVMLDHVKMAWVLAYSIQVLFQLQNYYPLSVFQVILFIFWFLNEGFFYFDIDLRFKKTKEKERNILDDFEEENIGNNNSLIIDFLLLFAAFSVAISFLFQALQWPFAKEVMLFSFSFFAIIIWFKKF